MNQQIPKLATSQPGLAQRSVDSSILSFRKSAFAMSRVVFFLIGLLLSVTAILKLWMLMTDPFAGIRLESPLWFVWLGVLADFLGLAVMVSCTSIRLRLAVATNLFFVFSIVSSIRWFSGHDSCGCAGIFSISPATMFFGDVVILFALFAVFWFERDVPVPERKWTWFESPSRQQEFFTNFFGAGFAILVVMAIYQLDIGGFGRLCNPNYGMTKQTVNIGEFNSGEPKQFLAEIRNPTTVQMKFVGYSSSCQCAVLTADIGVVDPESKRDIIGQVITKKKGKFAQRIIVFVESDRVYRYSIDIFGNCT